MQASKSRYGCMLGTMKNEEVIERARWRDGDMGCSLLLVLGRGISEEVGFVYRRRCSGSPCLSLGKQLWQSRLPPCIASCALESRVTPGWEPLFRGWAADGGAAPLSSLPASRLTIQPRGVSDHCDHAEPRFCEGGWSSMHWTQACAFSLWLWPSKLFKIFTNLFLIGV